MNEKQFAFYYLAKNEEFANYYFQQLFFYAFETLRIDHEKQCLFYGDVGNTAQQKYKLMDNLDNIQCVVLPAYHHLNPSRTLFYELYERKFMSKGIYVICLNEEVSRDE
ncbi:hypothetical protein [Sutcliffiella cohnii]|uniref:hypothetical protein n=1 Tax=Sutcliffiella cohnii TaxID=33932 RepID=UPI002E1E406E|nr:hypothetical protein [Sutcliffiella cohnii]